MSSTKPRKYEPPKVLVNPTEHDSTTGIRSSIGYDNENLVTAIRQVFGCQPDEHITQLEFRDIHMTATIARLPR